MMKERENMDIWLEGGVRGEQEHGHDKKDFWDAVSTGSNCGRVKNEWVLTHLICAKGFTSKTITHFI